MIRGRVRGILGGLTLAVMAASAVYGGGFFGLRERVPPPASVSRGDPFTPVAGDGDSAARAGRRRSAPYWRPLRRFAGTGSATTPAFTIDARAIQWRVSWRCERGPLEIRPLRPSGDAAGHRLAPDVACPREGTGLSVAQGDFRLAVSASGPWEAAVEQQVDVPLAVPLSAEARQPGARLVADGEFYDVDEDGQGTLRLYRLPDGSGLLRVEDFYVTPNVDLEIRLSELTRPRTTQQVLSAPFEDVEELEATAGAMNFRIPAGAFGDRVRSVVIWCEETRNAYAAAALRFRRS